MLSNMIVLYLILFTSSIFISSNWVLTNLSTLAISIGTVVYYRFRNIFEISELSISVLLIMILL